VLYQAGSVAAMLDPKELIAQFTDNAGLAEGTLMFCGTLSAQGAVRAAADFEYELHDPVLGRKIGHRYRIRTLPML
jgi:2-keto-4-pentenoate hydratase/2-oxohepta-3-ene-1,7-dioic acid hydratase in catechol pathway